MAANTKELGRIIKEARLSKKLTQSEVVGDRITRNMLSQIESGTAMPSLKTLDYLCRRLDITLDAAELTGKTAAGEYLNIRWLYTEGKYREVLDAQEDPEFADETAALKAKAAAALAEELSRSESIEDNQQAVEYAKLAGELSEKGLFASRECAEAAEKALREAAGKLSRYYNSFV